MTTDYEIQADKWAGDKPKHLSDWIARPVMLKKIQEIGKGKILLDMGCGTGYFSRKAIPFVKKIIAFEKSPKMLEIAKQEEKENPLGIEYLQGDMTNMGFIKSKTIDICVLNFVLPYIHPNEYKKVFAEITRVLKPKGKFLIIQSHPCMFALAPNHKNSNPEIWRNYNYKKSRGKYVEFKLNKAGGGFVTVGQYHYTFEDLFKHCEKNNLAFQNIKELEVLENLPKELDATIGEVPYIYLEGVKLK
ncbi:class I SAM-dependent methyltransferase [Candidatus Pacearchaeota archaeon]|nr:class I SAM-dependent methyltransferase [Candidatus Pacearchaeota archaeon]